MHSFKNPFRSSIRPLESPAPISIPTAFTTFTTRFACMSFNLQNRIRLMKFAEEEVLAIRHEIGQVWRPGLKLIRDVGESREIQVRRKPWAPSYHGNDDARRLLLAILQKCHETGWILAWTVNATRGLYNKDTLIFRKQWPPPPPCVWIVMSFDSTDKIKIIDSPPDLTRAMLEALGDQVRDKSTPGRFKVHIRGRPWEHSDSKSVERSSLLLKLIQTLERRGFTIYAAVGDNMLVCQRAVDWRPGDQIRHR
ncbi:hypothetical protein NW768_011529 [Fusarium equiseti]|uniref:Uncharacterized protein n=1 Tax=Fusarium equiseti TaxID=61235 RepID=A0ABQ8QXD2_FUSEQ|nr:hypothetical protein NW768_011529 [Fusarium equiseti]